MAKLVLLEQHLERQPSTVVTQATTWWETILAHVKLQDGGLGMNLPVNVCCYYSSVLFVHIYTYLHKRSPWALVNSEVTKE